MKHIFIREETARLGKRHDSLPKGLELTDTKLPLERFAGNFAPTSTGMPTGFGEEFVEVFIQSNSQGGCLHVLPGKTINRLCQDFL